MKQHKIKESPFGKGKSRLFTADIEPGGGSYSFASYALGYFHAAHLLVWDIAKTNSAEWSKWNLHTEDAEFLLDNANVDELFYPIIFLYRHGTELMTKHFIYDKPDAPSFDDAARRHDLTKLWQQARDELTKFFSLKRAEKAGLHKLDVFVQKICQIDLNAEASRFPLDLKKRKSFQSYDGARIDLKSIHDSAVEAEELFMTFVEGRMEEWEYMTEDAAYYGLE